MPGVEPLPLLPVLWEPQQRVLLQLPGRSLQCFSDLITVDGLISDLGRGGTHRGRCALRRSAPSFPYQMHLLQEELTSS